MFKMKGYLLAVRNFNVWCYFLAVFDFFVLKLESAKEYCDETLLKVQSLALDGCFISYSIYDKKTQRYHRLYDYDGYSGCLVFLFRFLLKSLYIVPIHTDGTGTSCVDVGSYIKDNEKFYIINDLPVENIVLPFKCVYCLLNNTLDLTHEFNVFLNSIFENNRLLTCNDLAIILTSFFKKHCEKEEDDYSMKIMFDDTFEELLFKGNDIVNIHNGR